MNKNQSARQQYTFDEVYQQYTPLVWGMLKRLNIHSNHEDFLQAGYIGLWLAYRHHDGEKGPFPPYAFVRVRGEMLTMLSKEANYQNQHVFSSENPDPIENAEQQIHGCRKWTPCHPTCKCYRIANNVGQSNTRFTINRRA